MSKHQGNAFNRERETKTERETEDRERDRERETERDTERERQRQRQRQRQRERCCWVYRRDPLLVPLLFSLYTVPISEIADRHGVSMHFYADDI